MKLTYAITVEDYRGFHPGFAGRAGNNAGFKGVLIACFLMALLGVFCMIQGMGILLGCFLAGLGVLSACVAYLFDKSSVRRAKKKYEGDISIAYQRLHCREQRILQTDEKGFTVSCKCGVVSRPWSELMRISENMNLFFMATAVDSQIVPKAAFSSEGEITEFRALVREKIDLHKQWTSRPIDFALTGQDFRGAYFVHVSKGGGWRSLSKRLLIFGCWVYLAYVVWTYVSPRRDVPALCALLGWVLFMSAWSILRLRRKRHQGPLRMYFGEEGLYLQDPGTTARNSWQQFIGYLENDRMFLLYYSPLLYRIVPKRVFIDQGAEFREVLKTKLQRYNYRCPFPIASEGSARSESTS